MQENNMIDLLGSLKEMSSEQLSRLIQEETAKECPNDEMVLMVLDILEDREKEEPVKLGPKGKAAWKKYQSKVRARQKNTILIWKPMMQVASVLVVITLLLGLIPTQANAETWWERLARWTDDFFSFFNPNESDVPEDVYVFNTDNEGLQQVYDAVVGLNIFDPVVPMWIPNGHELVDLTISSLQNQTVLVATFRKENEELVFSMRALETETPLQYFKDETDVLTYEKQGIVHIIMENNGLKIVTWTRDNVECFFTIDCQKDILFRIVDSIYRRN